MKNLLITVDPDSTEATEAAVNQAIALADGQPAQVHVLSVQPRVSSHVSRFFAREELQAHQYEAGSDELARALAQLSQARVASVPHVRVGRRAETIAATAQELGCDTILLGADLPTDSLGRLFGSVAHQVRHMLEGSAPGCRVIGA